MVPEQVFPFLAVEQSLNWWAAHQGEADREETVQQLKIVDSFYFFPTNQLKLIDFISNECFVLLFWYVSWDLSKLSVAHTLCISTSYRVRIRIYVTQSLHENPNKMPAILFGFSRKNGHHFVQNWTPLENWTECYQWNYEHSRYSSPHCVDRVPDLNFFCPKILM